MQSTLSCTDEAVRPSTPLDVSMGEAAEECVAEAPATAPKPPELASALVNSNRDPLLEEPALAAIPMRVG